MFWLYISTKTANTFSAPSNTKSAAKKTMQRQIHLQKHTPWQQKVFCRSSSFHALRAVNQLVNDLLDVRCTHLFS